MKTIALTILLVFITLMPTTSRASLLDTPIEGSTLAEIKQSINNVQRELPAQESKDLGNAIVSLGAECIKQIKLGMSKDESDDIYIALSRGQTPRQIILSAAGILISQSSSILNDPDWSDPEKLDRKEVARRQDLYVLRSRGVDLLKRYANPSK